MNTKQDSPIAQSVIDRIVTDIEGGKGAYKVAKELNADQIAAPHGDQWSRSSVETAFKKATGIESLSEMRGARASLAKRTTIKLPKAIDAQLRSEAKLRGVTVSALTREAIEAYLNGGQSRQFLAAGAGRSGKTDISQRIEEILREEWSP